MLRYLQNNRIVGILIDQNMARHDGVFVEIFFSSCLHNRCSGPFGAAHKSSCDLSFALRIPGGKYRLIFGKPIETTETGDLERDVLVNTQEYTKAIETMVRQYPDQWLWVHQRWKTKPYQNN